MLASVIREVIAPVLRACPASCQMVSITEVDVSDDFSYATVYISALQEQETALTFLEKQLPQLHKSLGAIHRSRIPQLRFRVDPRTERGGRVDDLLHQENQDT